jgi:YVTN family beta-propeller protein
MFGRGAIGIPIGAGLLLVALSCSVGKVADRPSSDPPTPVYRSPNHLALSADGRRAYVANQSTGSVSILDVTERKVIGEIPVGPHPSHIAVSPDGRNLLVTSVHDSTLEIVDLEEMRVVRSIATGWEPYGVSFSADAERIYVANSLSNTVSVIDAASGVVHSEIPVGRSPRFLAETPDGKRLVVANALSRFVSIVDVEAGRVVATRDLGRAGVLRQIVRSRDGRWAFVAHIISHDEFLTLQMERGMTHSNGFSVMDLEQPGHRVTLLLDRLMAGAANPWGLAISSDDRRLYVSLAGVHEIAIVDLPKVLDLVAKVEPAEVDRLSKDVEILDRRGIMRRVDAGGIGPRGIALDEATGELLVTNYFSDTVSVLDAETGEHLATIPLGPPQPMTVWRKGEMLFNDGRLCFQQWFSCASCHQEDATVDGLSWDLANDGLGNPKNAKSMHDVHDTPPAMWSGVRRDIDVAVAAGQRFLGFLPEPENHRALMAFIGSPRRAPNPYRRGDAEALKQGERVFHRARCHVCHPAPTFTDRRMHDVGVINDTDLRSRFDTPSLRECYRTGPFLHDGRAQTLRKIFTEHNPDDLHGLTSGLTEAEMDQLVAYLRSL